MRRCLTSMLFITTFSVMNLIAQQNDLPVLTGVYLGQSVPSEAPKLFARDILSTGSHELDITFTPDGNEIFFTRSGPDWYSAVLQFKKVNDRWIGPVMPAFSGRYQNNYPFITPDGKSIVYNSQQPVKNMQEEL